MALSRIEVSATPTVGVWRSAFDNGLVSARRIVRPLALTLVMVVFRIRNGSAATVNDTRGAEAIVV